ncbi:hypothetical protein T11_1793 [Trichinella zimbabwensis]|uniref:Uncharacterized protein n=1 Tax=Trichinella zimbabwensis TaxID=268475 RepID=A0A0V1GE43_9BILA|nr:hypothetical protein T11_1793 [Trichinella zimbabwensis]
MCYVHIRANERLANHKKEAELGENGTGRDRTK